MIYLQLFWEFFKTGLFSIGGGMATIPFLAEMSERLGWFTLSELADMVAIAESTPGPIGVNTATYVGNKICGIPGGIIATLGLITPSIIIILIMASLLDKFRNNKYVEAAFYGLRPASVGLIAAAGISIILIAFFGIASVFDFKEASFDFRYLILFAIVLILTRWVKATKKLHPLWFIGFAAVVGIIFKF